MPWIKQERRNRLHHEIKNLVLKMEDLYCEDDLTKGDINYVFYKLGKEIMSFNRRYTHMSNVTDVMKYASEELKRKILDPYEDEMEQKNGTI